MIRSILKYLFRLRDKHRKKQIEERNIVLLESIRNKNVIKVAFVLAELAKWKTEPLYNAMLAHQRFDPNIYLTIANDDLPSEIISKYNCLKEYLNKKGYPFKEISNLKVEAPDITFFQQPYMGIYPSNMVDLPDVGICIHVDYCFLNTCDPNIENSKFRNSCALYFVENAMMYKDFVNILDNKGRNLRLTGLPVEDILLSSSGEFDDPWKKQSHKKKRIIWAPHFTYREGLNSCLNMSCFLSMYQPMLEIAEKYKDQIQIAFKPHPCLYGRLVSDWGEKRTRDYFDEWANRSNCQLETGEYVGLFKHSDAMVHDSASYIIEYLYVDKPVMFTFKPESHMESFNDSAKTALKGYAIGHNMEDVESFIIDVINDKDAMKSKREELLRNYYLPPNEKTACENIINAILGEAEYK